MGKLGKKFLKRENNLQDYNHNAQKERCSNAMTHAHSKQPPKKLIRASENAYYL